MTQLTILESLVEEIADTEDKGPKELEVALQDHISTDAIRRLEKHESESWMLQFELPNHTVQIVGDGTILVNDTAEQSTD